MITKGKKITAGILFFIILSTPALAQKPERPLCLPVEFETSPFFVHFKGPGAPTLVVIHGGFSSTKKSALFCRKFAQVLGDRYNIISVDYRFSSMGGGEMVDVMRGIKLAQEKFETPPQKIFLLGTSHGGYLALMAASKARVGGVIDAYGPTHWPLQLTFVKKHRPDVFKKWKIYLAISRSACRDMGLKFEQCLVKRSVVPSHLEGLEEPILILHGKKDNLVPLKESEILAQALRKRGKVASLKVFPNKGHGFPLWTGKPLEIIRRFLADLEKGQGK